MDVEMGTTDEEAAATDDEEVCAVVEADQETKKKREGKRIKSALSSIYTETSTTALSPYRPTSVAIAPVLEVELAEAFSWAVTTPREATTARSKVDLLNILMGVCVFVWL